MPGRNRTLEILAVATILAWCTRLATANAAGPVPSANHPNVILLVIDTLRADFVWNSENASPDGLAKSAAALGNAVYFTNCQAQSSWTRPSMCTLFTGLYPASHGVLRGYGAEDRGGDSDGEEHKLRAPVVTLAEVLQDAGYRTFAIQTNPHLGTALGVSQGFEQYLYKNDAPGSWVTDTALQWIARTSRARVRGGDPPPFFVYLHYLDPHMPYVFHEDISYPEGTEEHGVDIEHMIEGGLTDREIEQQRRLYRGEIQSLDRQIARFLSEFSGDPRWKNTIVILTSDHGEEFWEHGGFEHGHSLYDEVLRVPLFIGGPALGLTSRFVTDQVRLLDLMPTVLDLCGVHAIATQGETFAPSLQAGEALNDRISFAEGILYGEQRWSYRDSNSKRILSLASGASELFDANADALEESNLVPQLEDAKSGSVASGSRSASVLARVAEIDALLSEWHKENRRVSDTFGPMEPAVHDPAQRERLRSLGYIR